MPANPIFGNLGGFGGPIGGWGSYNRSRGVPLNANPNLSSGEYAARLASMGNPTGAQSYTDYMNSDDYAQGWRGNGATPAANYVVPTTYGDIPNVIPVGASIVPGQTGGGTTTPPPATGGGWSPRGPFGDLFSWLFGGGQGAFPGWTGSGGTTNPNPTPGGGSSPSGGFGGGAPRTPDPWGNTTTNPNNMSYPANYPGIPTGSYVGNPNNMSYVGAQSPTPAQNPTVVQEWANKRKGNGNNKRNR